MVHGERSPRKRTYAEAMQASSPRFHHEISKADPARFGIERNLADIKVALSCVPKSSTDDVEHFLAKITSALGLSRNRALQYVDIGMQLERMPRLKRLLLGRAHLPFLHMRVIATAALPLDDPTAVEYFEESLLDLITPRINGETLRGVRSLQKQIQRIINEIDPLMCPRDEFDTPQASLNKAMKSRVGEFIDFQEKEHFTEVTMELVPERALEFQQVLDLVAADQNCGHVEALSRLIHGSAEVTATLNLYCPLTKDRPQEAWLAGAGWISEIATESWLNRVSSVRLLADEKTNGYTPSERQRAYVQGRDGTCRFPGCDVDATKCDIDHIEPYNHESPEDGGQTETPNLHCLCRRHHNLKTAGLWNVVRDIDGVEYWTSATDKSAEKEALISTESGPMAGHGRYSFDLRKTRKTKTLKEHNEQRLEMIRYSQEVLNQTRVLLGLDPVLNPIGSEEPAEESTEEPAEPETQAEQAEQEPISFDDVEDEPPF